MATPFAMTSLSTSQSATMRQPLFLTSEGDVAAPRPLKPMTAMRMSSLEPTARAQVGSGTAVPA